MGLSDDAEDNVEQRYEELCLDLNMDKKAKTSAWFTYVKIRTNYSLEGDQIHWLACALYEACRRSVVPTVGRGTVEGNCVSLTRLLRSAKFSLIAFFNKMKKWADMANLPKEFRDKLDKLERNFAVSTVIFKKFEPIFLDIFKCPADEPPRQPRSRKQRKLPCSLMDVFNFCWTMFVQVKGNFPAISDDLVNSYHLLLCNIDWFYTNALLGCRKDLINPDFSGLPEGYHSRDWKPPTELPCIIKLLCDKHEGLEIEAKVIKEHWWKPHLKKLFEKKVLRGKPETLSAVLEIGNFEINKKAVNNGYEEYVLSVGDFDERIFLDEDAEEEIGTPARSHEEMAGELTESMQKKTNMQQHFDQTQSLAPSTPLTGRRYLKEKDATITPVSTATQGVSRLQHLLSGRKTTPNETLLELFLENGGGALKETITCRVKEMGQVFCSHYVQPSDEHPGGQMDFARRRLQLAECLYYKTLENILFAEKARAGSCTDQKANLSGLMQHEVFHRSLFACCLEIIIFSYNSQRMFPWIVEIFDLSPYHFYKVVEVIVRAEEGLSRDVVKHLNHIEECILESLAWKSDSPLWDQIKAGDIPLSAEVSLPAHSDHADATVRHPALRRLVMEQRQGVVVKDPLQSPTGPSATDRFSSPSPGSAKRRLFAGGAVSLSPSAGTVIMKPAPTLQGASGVAEAVAATGGEQQKTQLIAIHHTYLQDGKQVLIPVQAQVLSSQAPHPTPATQATVQPEAPTDPSAAPAAATKPKPLKSGSLALFFRKVYHLAHVRLRDLCERLDIEDEDQQRKMWTCLEHTLVHHTGMMMDRHLDQQVMCAVYVMAKVIDKPQSFQNIMKCYRLQPQAQSHVYRSVLLNSRNRHTSGSSDGSRAEASGSSSPSNLENRDDSKEKKSVPIRSSSTLPIPHPSSHPPTPTRLLGLAPSFDFSEERGDLIQFYNQVFITKVRKFVLKFSSGHQSGDAPPLSPLPAVRCHTTSPRRVSNHCSVYISPHKAASHRDCPRTTVEHARMLYCFNRSPAKTLSAINSMIRRKEEKSTQYSATKRTLMVDGEEEPEVPSKRVSLMRRLQDISSERKEASTKVVVTVK